MASTIMSRAESPSRTFKAGKHVFTRFQARQCAIMHGGGATLWEIKEQHHPQASLKEICVAIQVGQMWAYSFADMVPDIFDPKLICLAVWPVGEPTRPKMNKKA